MKFKKIGVIACVCILGMIGFIYITQNTIQNEDLSLDTGDILIEEQSEALIVNGTSLTEYNTISLGTAISEVESLYTNNEVLTFDGCSVYIEEDEIVYYFYEDEFISDIQVYAFDDTEYTYNYYYSVVVGTSLSNVVNSFGEAIDELSEEGASTYVFENKTVTFYYTTTENTDFITAIFEKDN